MCEKEKASRLTQGCTAMMFTKGEIEILGLCALCKDLPVGSGGFSEQKAIDSLLWSGLLRKSNCGLSYRVSTRGYDYLQNLGLDFERDKTYLGKSKALYRRLETAKITGFFMKSGAEVFRRERANGSSDNIFVPSFTFRRKTFSNPLGGTRLAGFYYLRDTMFVPYYIARENNGIHTDVEERTFTSEYVLKKYSPTVLFTGEGDLSEVLSVSYRQTEKKEKVNTDSYAEAITKFRTPVAFITLDSNGLDVINILSVKDYRTKLARLILLGDYGTSDLTDSDGINFSTKENFVIGIDCNVERMKRVIGSSGKTTHILLLPFQQGAVQHLLKGANARLHTVEVGDVEGMLGIGKRKFQISGEPFRNEKGGYAYVPIVRPNQKIRGQNRTDLQGT